MELWMVMGLYGMGLALILAETVLPGITMGLIGTALLAISTVFGFRHHWAIGAGQIGAAVAVIPLCFWMAMRRLSLKTALQGDSFSQSYDALVGKEGRAHTDLRPAGIVIVEGRKIDVVTGGERIEKGRRVQVTKVEGNRIVVRSI